MEIQLVDVRVIPCEINQSPTMNLRFSLNLTILKIFHIVSLDEIPNNFQE